MAMDQDIATAKAALRTVLKRTIASLSAERRLAGAAAAASSVLDLPSYQTASLILAFLSMASEIDTSPLIEAALRDGKRVAVPRIDGDDIAFVELAPDWRSWPRDRWDIPTPPPAAPTLAPEAIARLRTLALVPGLAFDDAGRRLGRGKGYYDRFLASVAAEFKRSADRAMPFVALGYGFAEQRLERVPAGKLDRQLDGLILA